MTALCESAPVADLKPNTRNARTHSKRQIQQIVESIKTFGFTNPLLIDADNGIIAGHGRLEAALALQMKSVPVIRLTHLTSAEQRALMLADNKIAMNAGWNTELLAAELADLSAMHLDFDTEVTGFEVAEIDLAIEEQHAVNTTQESVALADHTVSPITRPRDVWMLGAHRILCGNARSATDLQTLMQGETAAMGFTDPPYNVNISGHVCGNGKIQHREFAEASGEMSSAEFESFLREVFELGATHSLDGTVWFACIDWRHIPEMVGAGMQAFGNCLNMCVWAKTNGGMGSLYRSQHELVFVFRTWEARHRNNVQLGKFGRNRTNLWTYPGVNTFRAGRMEDLQAHPTAKPVQMVKDAILDVSRRGDIVLDPFLGAGATLMAAELCGRIAYGLEIDPAYVDVALRRWQVETGQDPVRMCDQRSFSSLEMAMQTEVAQ